MRALLFDFDGLLVDTESAEFHSWQEIYRRHGSILTVEEWLQAVGYVDNFDPRATLEKKIGRSLDWNTLDPIRSALNVELASKLPPLPGGRELMLRGRNLGYKIAVVSNSFRAWVQPGLERLGIFPLVDVLCVRGDTEHVKPHPAPYLHALRLLGAAPAKSYAFEDSNPGVRSARAAGLTVIAVPNQLTKHQDLSQAHRILTSLEEMPLENLLSEAPSFSGKAI